MDTFFSGKLFYEKYFDQNFEQMTNQQIAPNHQLEQKQGRDNVWYNGDAPKHELDNVVNKLHNTASSSDENNFHPKMIVKSGPKFRTCLVNLFKSCLTNRVWPWTESRVLFNNKPCKPDYTVPFHIDLSASAAMLVKCLRGY